jgi:hypothetical protein
MLVILYDLTDQIEALANFMYENEYMNTCLYDMFGIQVINLHGDIGVETLTIDKENYYC